MNTKALLRNTSPCILVESKFLLDYMWTIKKFMVYSLLIILLKTSSEIGIVAIAFVTQK